MGLAGRYMHAPQAKHYPTIFCLHKFSPTFAATCSLVVQKTILSSLHLHDLRLTEFSMVVGEFLTHTCPYEHGMTIITTRPTVHTKSNRLLSLRKCSTTHTSTVKNLQRCAMTRPESSKSFLHFSGTGKEKKKVGSRLLYIDRGWTQKRTNCAHAD